MLKSITAAERFLRILREPESMIQSIDEECILREDEAVRRVTIELTKKPLGKRDGWLYVDLLHPDYGNFVDLDIEPHPDIRKVSHSEHQAMARYLILARFVTVWVSVDGFSTDKKRDRFDRRMLEICRDLVRIPHDGVEDAAKTYEEHFDDSGQLRILSSFDGLRFDHGRSVGLGRLCKRLSTKYMSLVAVRVRAGLAPRIRYSYTFQLSPYKRGEARDGRHDTASTSWRARVGRRARDFVASPFRPHSFRVHLPAAKRAQHYSFRLEAPEGYFVAEQDVVVDNGNVFRALHTSDDVGFRWSINTGHGRRSALYIDQAHRFRHRIYLGVQNLEIPGESTSRAALLGALVLAALVGFTVAALTTVGVAQATGALVLALVAVGAFALAPSRGPGVLGIPLLSKLAPPTFGLICAVFIVWLATREAAAAEWVPAEVVTAVSGPYAIWSWWGWVVPVGACGILLGVIIRRRKILRERFKAASGSPYIVSDRMLQAERDRKVGNV